MRNHIISIDQLQPIIRKTVTSLYGSTMKNIKIHEAERIPLFKEPKQYWQVDVLFNDEEYQYVVQFEVEIADGLVTKVHETHRDPINR